MSDNQDQTDAPFLHDNVRANRRLTRQGATTNFLGLSDNVDDPSAAQDSIQEAPRESIQGDRPQTMLALGRGKTKSENPVSDPPGPQDPETALLPEKPKSGSSSSFSTFLVGGLVGSMIGVILGGLVGLTIKPSQSADVPVDTTTEMTARIEQITKEKDLFFAKHQDASAQLAILSASHASLIAAMTSLRQAADPSRYTKTAEELTVRIRERDALRDERNRMESEMNALRIRHQELMAVKDTATKESEEYKEALAKTREALRASQAQQRDLAVRLESRDISLQAVTSERDKLKKSLTDTTAEVQKLRTALYGR
jgi:gas vesicle protein